MYTPKNKLSYDEVKLYIESFGHKLISDIYINFDSKLIIECPNGHVNKTTFRTFKKNKSSVKCRECTGKKKYEMSHIIDTLNSFGYELISNSYKNCNTKLEIKCSNGHVFYCTFDGIVRKNQRCIECLDKRRKYTHESVKEDLELKGFRLLSEFKSVKDYINIECPNGHVYKIKYYYFLNNHGCAECSGVKKYTIDQVREYVESVGYKLLSTSYVNANSKLEIMCPDGHIFNTKFSPFKNKDTRCGKCFYKNNRGENNPSWNGGNTPEHTLIRKSPPYLEWKYAVFKRDNRECQCCGSKKDLRAHHIESFAKNPELRTELSNGITLCSSCHDSYIENSFHNLYGTWNNNREQLENYLNWRKQGGKLKLKKSIIYAVSGVYDHATGEIIHIDKDGKETIHDLKELLKKLDGKEIKMRITVTEYEEHYCEE